MTQKSQPIDNNRLKDIRILYLLDYLNISGSKTHVLCIAENFRKRGMHVVIAGKKGAYGKIFENYGFPVRYINFYGDGEDVRKKLKKVIKEENIQIMHAHQLVSARYASEVSKINNIPLVTTFHGTYYNDKKMVSISQKSDAIISCSYAVEEYLKNKLNIYSSVLIPNGINLEEFYYVPSSSKLRKKFSIPNGVPIVLYPSRQDGRKYKIGLEIMDACHQYRKKHGTELHCIFAGTGKGKNKIIEAANKYNHLNGTPFIHVIGTYYDMPSLHSLSTIVVGTGRSGMEAMCCERPLIAAGIQGFRARRPDDGNEGGHRQCR